MWASSTSVLFMEVFTSMEGRFGVVMTLIAFAISIWLKFKHDMREDEKHKQQMQHQRELHELAMKQRRD